MSDIIVFQELYSVALSDRNVLILFASATNTMPLIRGCSCNFLNFPLELKVTMCSHCSVSKSHTRVSSDKVRTEVRWLSKRACLSRYYELFETILEFFQNKDPSLRDSLKKCKSDIAYMADLGWSHFCSHSVPLFIYWSLSSLFYYWSLTSLSY
ncbi:hypothetical protein T12_15394 [Trichinella patagoniensis]|uniref:Uncharacterized protein n=1 Tax=Trichinella patagoniensis TaxID=990121 RepID=A0A0V0Z928_9BILA|nr:hypothetical protein T12_15394 [Trichinella patagoniensis]